MYVKSTYMFVQCPLIILPSTIFTAPLETYQKVFGNISFSSNFNGTFKKKCSNL